MKPSQYRGQPGVVALQQIHMRRELARGLRPEFIRSQTQTVNAVCCEGQQFQPAVLYFAGCSDVLAEFSAGDGTSSSFAFGNTFPSASVTA